MSLLLAAVGATAAALIELTVVPYLRVGNAFPHLVLVLGVIWAIASRLEGGLVWAFVGGIALDVLAQRPLGSTALALLLSVGAAAVVAQPLARVRPLAPVAAVAVVSLGYSMILFILLGALVAPIPVDDPVPSLLPGLMYDVVVAAAIGPLAVAVHDRAVDQDRVDW
jgi:rod shape-determining protein MreD